VAVGRPIMRSFCGELRVDAKRNSITRKDWLRAGSPLALRSICHGTQCTLNCCARFLTQQEVGSIRLQSLGSTFMHSWSPRIQL
jgi:hypothetical protein